MDVHFIIGGENVTRANWHTLGPGVTEAEIDRIADTVLDAAGKMRCPRHGKSASVTCRGPSLRELTFEAAACCPEFAKAIETRLQQKFRPVETVDAVWEKPLARKSTAGRLNTAFGPILAGMVIDLVDMAAFGPIRRFVGFPAGAVAGYWMASIFKLPQKQRCLLALAAGTYCLIPGHAAIPVATMIGAYIRFRTYDEPEDPGESFQA